MWNAFTMFQRIFVGDVRDFVTEAPVAADSDVSRNFTD